MADGGRMLTIATATFVALLWWSSSSGTTAPDPAGTLQHAACARHDGPALGSTAPSVAANALAPPECRDTVAAQTAETDADWRNLPRSTKDFVLRILDSPQSVDARFLFRSVCFNPRDVYVSAGARAGIQDVIEAARSGLASMVEDLQATRDREFDTLHALGETVPVDLQTLEGQTALSRLGRDRIFVECDGRTYAARLSQLPATSRGVREVHTAASDLVVRIAESFHGAGTLSAPELEALAAKARRAASGG
jgi:hypothetical protein